MLPTSLLAVFATLLLSFNLNLLTNLERSLSQPIYYLKTALPHSKTSPAIKPNANYSIVLVGDSMTDFLGQGAPELKKRLTRFYPDKKFTIYNYGFGSTNILSLEERLTKATKYLNQDFDPILTKNFDIIFIESFGHNPLSNFSLEEGLKKQTESLDKAVDLITKSHPKSVIVFVSTIGPHKTRYAEGVAQLLPEQREVWVKERLAYIQNHIDYAKKHNIMLLNIYSKTLDKDGNTSIDYINTNDFIHPSTTGIILISEEVAKFIYTKRLLPL